MNISLHKIHNVESSAGKWIYMAVAALFFTAFFVVSTKLSDMVSAPDMLKTRYLYTGSFIILFCWLVLAYKEKKLSTFNLNFTFLALLAMFVWSGITIFWAFHKTLAGIAYLRWWQAALMFFLFLNFITNTKRVEQMLKILVYVGVILSVIGILQFYKLFEFVLQAVPPASTFGNRNMAMDALVMVMPFAFMFFMKAKNTHERILMAGFLLIFLVYVIYTYNRAGFFALVVETSLISCVLIYHYFRKKPLIDRQQTMMIAVVVVLALVLAAVGYEVQKLEFMGRYLQVDEFISGKGNGSTVHERMKIFYNTLIMIKDNPIFGIGFGNWTVYFPYYSGNNILMPKLLSSDPNSNVLYKQTHNEYLQIFAETGVIGFVLTLVFAGFLLWSIITLLKNIDKKYWYIPFGILVGFSGEAVNLGASFPLRVTMPFNIIVLYATILSVLLMTLPKVPKYLSNFTITISKRGLLIGMGLTLVLGVFVSYKYYHWIMGHKFRNYATSYVGAQRYPEAEVLLEKSLEYNPGDSDDTMYVLGNVYKVLGKNKEALAIFDKAFRTSLPYHPYMYNHMAVAYQANNDVLGAINILKHAVKVMPLQDGYYRNLGALYAKIGQYERAVLLYEKALEMNPKIYGGENMKMLVRMHRANNPNPFRFLIEGYKKDLVSRPKNLVSSEVN